MQPQNGGKLNLCMFSPKLVVLVVLAGLATAVPGGGYGKPKCRTEYETSYTTSYEEKCSTRFFFSKIPPTPTISN